MKAEFRDPPATLDLDLSRESVSLRQRATDRIRDAILSGTFAPGQRLVERELWQSLGISRTVVREALQHLQAEGLITIVPYKGPVVATLSLQDANDLYAVRAALESLACAGFAEHASAEQVAALRGALDFLRTPQASSTPKALLDAKNAFYGILLAGCGNRVIGDVLTQLNNRISVLRRVSLGSPGRLPQTIAELEEVVSAIERRDGETAARLAAAHVQRAAEIVRQSFASR
jgi:DNA-binding GntR family transcriptional regulator